MKAAGSGVTGHGEDPAQGDLLRLDPRRDGALFQLIGRADEEALWVRVENGDATPCAPEDDDRLPLAASIPALREQAPVEVIAYRPGRRIVLRVGEGEDASILKGYRSRRLEQARVRHAWAAEALSSGPLRAPPVPSVDERTASLRWPEARGRPVDLHPSGAGLFFRVGAGLAAMQAAEPWEGAAVHGLADELGVIDELSGAIEATGLPLPPGWRPLREAHDALDPLEPVPPVPTHRDLHDGQFLATREGPVLLDFDLLCLADPMLDPANLIAHIRLRELQGLAGATGNSVDRCGKELLEGLGLAAGFGTLRRLRTYQSLSFLRLALVYTLRPPWRHLARELVAVAERCLDEC